jgi:hypothetical protein
MVPTFEYVPPGYRVVFFYLKNVYVLKAFKHGSRRFAKAEKSYLLIPTYIGCWDSNRDRLIIATA